MKLIIEDSVDTITEIEVVQTILEIADFDVGKSFMLEADQSKTIVATGDIYLVDTDPPQLFIDPNGASRNVYLPSPTINNHGYIIVNTADNDAELLIVFSGDLELKSVQAFGGIGWFLSNGSYWVHAGGGGDSGEAGTTYQLFTNRSGVAINARDVVIVEPSHDKSINLTDIANDLRVIGVANSDIGVGEEGRVDTVSGIIVEVNCDTGAVNRGEYLVASATSGKAKSCSYFRTPSSFAVALTSKSAGAVGVVEAMLIQDIKQTIGAGFGWAMGGYDGSVITNAQRLTFPTETWASVAGAALLAGRFYPGGVGDTAVRGFTIGGSSTTASSGGQVTAFKTDFGSEVTSGQATANLAVARTYLSWGCNATLKGYVCGGTDTGGTVKNTVDIITYATMTRSAGYSLTSARASQRGQADGSYIYVSGDTAVTCDKITVSTDAVSAHPDGNLGDFAQGYHSLSFPSTAGYMAYKQDATSYSRKLLFSTGVASDLGSTLAQNQKSGVGNSNGVNVGYISGDSAAPRSQSSKFVLSTETYSNNPASALEVGKSVAAAFNNGAY